jgi:hypothetical protein
MILWKISTAISIKHQILTTFSINKKINSDSLYTFKEGQITSLVIQIFWKYCLTHFKSISLPTYRSPTHTGQI